MYTSLVLLALSGSIAPVATDVESPRWLTDYATAWRQGAQEKKPLAVFVGSGPSGWDQVSREGKLGQGAKELLSAQYVCLYIDTSTQEGKRLAQAFDVPQGVGLVISDRSGANQAFHHQGDLKSEDLEYYLKRYADPNHIVRTTETNPPERAAAPTSSSYYAPSVAPAFSGFRGFGGFGGGGC
jgi:hypothetical protein